MEDSFNGDGHDVHGRSWNSFQPKVPHRNNHKAGAIVPPSMYFEEDDLYEKHYNT